MLYNGSTEPVYGTQVVLLLYQNIPHDTPSTIIMTINELYSTRFSIYVSIKDNIIGDIFKFQRTQDEKVKF